MIMKTYIVEYRIGGGRWQRFDKLKARSSAGAIAQAAKHLQDIAGDLEISACSEE